MIIEQRRKRRSVMRLCLQRADVAQMVEHGTGNTTEHADKIFDFRESN